MDEILGDMGPAIAALSVVAFLAALAMAARRRFIGDPKVHRKRAVDQATMRKHQTTNPILMAVDLAARPEIDLDGVHAAVPDFALAGLLDQLRGWFHGVQAHRVDRNFAAVSEHFQPGALDVAAAAGPGLEHTQEIWVLGIHPLKFGGTTDGCTATVRIRALVQETRNGAPGLVEVDETWTLGWPPTLKQWRVQHVQRNWRRLLDAPRLRPDPEAPAANPRPDPSLESLADRVDIAGVEAAAQLAIPEVARAAAQGDGAALGALVTPGFAEFVRGWPMRFRHFDQTPDWTVDVDAVTLVRVLPEGEKLWATVRITGESTLALTSPDTDGAEPLTQPWSRYATFLSLPDGAWQLAWWVEDNDWTVSVELPG